MDNETIRRVNAGWHQAREDLRDLAQHLRHCRECGETDVLNCGDGKPLWLKCFPNDVPQNGLDSQSAEPAGTEVKQS